jgi:hypothetical protein
MINTILLALLTPVVAAPTTVGPVELSSGTGRVLVLDNERALEGDIRSDGNNVWIRRPIGEVSLPADKILKVCANWEEAYTCVRSRANMRDPDERLRMARWCMAYGLREQALAEATAAVQMRPNHAASRQLLMLLQRPPAVPLPPSKAQAIAKTPPRPTMAIDLSAEAVAVFTARVQAVLMNTCASCHAADKNGAFSLTRTYGNSAASRRMTQQNLSAVLPFIDPDRPNASPLLLRAVTDHGKSGQAPLKAQSPPFRILQDWIQLTLATNPFLREQHTPSAPTEVASAKPAHPSETLPALAPVVSQPVPTIVESARPVLSSQAAAPPVDSVGPQRPAPHQLEAPAPASGTPLDEFDPAIFNQQNHSQKHDEPEK